MQNLIDLLNIPASFDAVALTKTSDGFYLARTAGDCGFNLFLGKPNRPHDGPGLERSRATWQRFTFGERRGVVRVARGVGVDLRRELFGRAPCQS